MAATIVGLKIRETRRALGISQSELARQMGISPAYLNLIEFSKRRIGGSLLKKAADCLHLSPAELDGAMERRLATELREIAADPNLRAGGLSPENIDAFIGRFPDWAGALAQVYRSNRANGELATALSDRLTHDPYLSDVVHQMVTHISAIRSTSEILDEIEDIETAQRARFHRTLATESSRLTDVAQALAQYFDKAHTAERTATPVEEIESFMLSHDNHYEALEVAAEEIREREFADGVAAGGMARESAMAAALERRGVTVGSDRDAGNSDAGAPADSGRHTVPLPLGAGSDVSVGRLAEAVVSEFMDEAIADLITDQLGAVARRHIGAILNTYAADALLLPAAEFQHSAKRLRNDIEALAQTWQVGFERVCRRLTAVSGRDSEGPGFAYLAANAAGNTIDRRPRPDLQFPRYGSACALWAIYRAFAVPETVIRQVAMFPDGEKVLFVARARRTGPAGFDRPADFVSDMIAVSAEAAESTVYGDGLDFGPRGKAEPVGPNCRICPRQDCLHRSDDPLIGRLQG